MSTEKNLSHRVIQSLRGMHPVPVDNPRRAGTPDINYIEGWLELKYLPSWPKRAETKVKIRCWTKKQMIWHYLRTSSGGRSFVLLQVGRDHLLFDGGVAALCFNESTQEDMRRLAIKVWDKYPGDELCQYLR